MTLQRRIDRWFDPRLEVRASPIHGRGVFTREAVRAGETLMRWGGVLIPATTFDEARYRASSTTRFDDAHWLTTPVDEPITLDEYLNHSCDPSTWMVDEVTVVARHDLAAGDEVTTDFALWGDDGYRYTDRCRCGSSLCRGVVTGDDWQLTAVAERYRGHFIPCIEARVARAFPGR